MNCQCLTDDGRGPPCSRKAISGQKFCQQHLNCQHPVTIESLEVSERLISQETQKLQKGQKLQKVQKRQNPQPQQNQELDSTSLMQDNAIRKVCKELFKQGDYMTLSNWIRTNQQVRRLCQPILNKMDFDRYFVIIGASHYGREEDEEFKFTIVKLGQNLYTEADRLSHIGKIGDMTISQISLGQFLDKFMVLGDINASKIWVIIYRYFEHGFLDEVISRGGEGAGMALCAFIFANTLEEAKYILNSRHVCDYVRKLVGFDAPCMEGDPYYIDTLSLIKVTCDGDFGLVPEKWYPLIRKILSLGKNPNFEYKTIYI